jgi:hypothetical protein
MKALLIKSKNGKDASVIACGKVSELSKKIRNLTEFPVDSDLVQLWERNGGVRKSVTISQFKSRAARSETPEIVSPDVEESNIEEAKKIKSEKAKSKRAEKAQAKKELSEVQAEAIKALSE